ncbi:hypothetical protein LCGC14_2486910 [marine sediment metagenome]|uniref:site-specific DNA-methyltransferase (adenine-specific) n=1 Tax=marine sediment metagenome TaxID=412755 RepID=A0A0F9DZN4_9ZZZZ
MKVCEKEFPKGSYKGQKTDGYHIDDYRKEAIDIMAKKIVNDIVCEQITNQITDVVEKYGNCWTKPIIFDALSALVSEYDKKKLGAVDTSLDLVTEMLDSIPAKAFRGTVLDPVCGRGIFLWRAKQIMIAQGITEQRALNKITEIDIDIKKCYITSALLDPTNQYSTKISVRDSLAGDWKMKFDIIVGNPPYQAKTASDKDNRQVIWPKFLSKMMNDLLDDKGHLAFITPRTWAAGSRTNTKNFFRDHKVKYLNMNVSGYFNVVADLCSYVIQKTSNKDHQTPIIDINGKITNVKIGDYPYLPFNFTELGLSIFTKTIIDYNDKFNFVESKKQINEYNGPRIAFKAGRNGAYIGRIIVDDGTEAISGIGQIHKLKSFINLQDYIKLENTLKLNLYQFLFDLLGGNRGLNRTWILNSLPRASMRWRNLPISKPARARASGCPRYLCNLFSSIAAQSSGVMLRNLANCSLPDKLLVP